MGQYEYLKDHRTGLCFLRVEASVDPIIVVPCTSEVERVIVNPVASVPANR
jgi:hypothetical protein